MAYTCFRPAPTLKTQMNTHMYAFALRNTTINHIRGCVVKILYPTLPRFQSKMAIVNRWKCEAESGSFWVDALIGFHKRLRDFGEMPLDQ